jgi:hypothetical protein
MEGAEVLVPWWEAGAPVEAFWLLSALDEVNDSSAVETNELGWGANPAIGLAGLAFAWGGYWESRKHEKKPSKRQLRRL